MKVIIFMLSALGLIPTAQGQIDDTSYIKSHAIPIADRKDLSDTVYSAISDYRVILIGELHGTAEPAEFVEGMAKTFLKHGRDVVIGMEIPANEIQEFAADRTLESLKASKFFTRERDLGTAGDGRASKAWANLIIALNDTKVRFVFFDITAKQNVRRYADRDSLMFENINAALKRYPDAVFIGLTGNVHNMSQKYEHRWPMAWYLQHAPNSNLKDATKLLCLVHIFDTGTMNNNSGNGLSVVEYKNSASGIFGTTVDYDNYLLIGNGYKSYSGILFSRTVHASLVWQPSNK